MSEDKYDEQVVHQIIDNMKAEITDLKQQLAAYKEYHDARDSYDRAVKEPGFLSNGFSDEILRVRKANTELQLLRNKGN